MIISDTRDDPQGRRAPAVAPRLGPADRRDAVRDAARRPRAVMSSSWPSTRFGPQGHVGQVAERGRRASTGPCPASSTRPIGPRWRSIHSRTTGSEVVHMSSRGSRLRATPSTTTMVFCSITSSVRVAMSNRDVISNSSVSSFAIEISSARRSWIGSPMARIACAKSSTE